MRRRVAVLAGLAVALTLVGCSRPAGVDGNLVNNWPAMPVAKTGVPVVGACYSQTADEVWFGPFDSVDCATTPHQTETVYVGAFTGSRSTPPDPDETGAGLAPQYTQCQQAATTYLGGDWHTALVGLQLVHPSTAAWSVGARWFRCDLVHYADPDGQEVVQDGVLKGDLSGPRRSAYGCLTINADKQRQHVLSSTPVDCAKPHGAEFAGTFTAPDRPWQPDDAAREKIEDEGCEAVVSKFLGFSSLGQWNNSAVGWWELGFDETLWTLGDRTVQCFAFAFTTSGNFVGSVKGIRNQKPKG
jgi:hypothetical protein